MTLLSFSETNTSFDPPSAHFFAQSALSMSFTPHFSSLTQPLILVALGALSLATDTVVKNANANRSNRIFFMGSISSEDFVRLNCVAAASPLIVAIELPRRERLRKIFYQSLGALRTIRWARALIKKLFLRLCRRNLGGRQGVHDFAWTSIAKSLARFFFNGFGVVL